jgi:adenosylcobinamide-phosphate synthase
VRPATRFHRHLRGAAAGYLVDQLIGELPDGWHPLRAFGHLMTEIERALYVPRRTAGAAYTAMGTTAGLVAGLAMPSAALACYFTVSARALAEAAMTVDRALAIGDLGAARQELRALVGRDTGNLSAAEMARAVVESVAENTNDGVIAPLLFGVFAGASGAYGYRAANTLDSLVGYRNDRYGEFGWASARVDDVASFLPARITAILVALVRPRRAKDVVRVVRRDAHLHPSPNAGVAECAFAGALGLRLGGANSYAGVVEHRPVLGDGRPALPGDIARAVRLSRDVGTAAAAVMGLLSLCLVKRLPSSSEARTGEPGEAIGREFA